MAIVGMTVECCNADGQSYRLTCAIRKVQGLFRYLSAQLADCKSFILVSFYKSDQKFFSP